MGRRKHVYPSQPGPLSTQPPVSPGAGALHLSTHWARSLLPARPPPAASKAGVPPGYGPRRAVGIGLACPLKNSPIPNSTLAVVPN